MGRLGSGKAQIGREEQGAAWGKRNRPQETTGQEEVGSGPWRLGQVREAEMGNYGESSRIRKGACKEGEQEGWREARRQWAGQGLTSPAPGSAQGWHLRAGLACSGP